MSEKREGTEKELLQYLVQENILLHAQFRSLKTVFKFIFAVLQQTHQEEFSDPSFDAEKLEELYLKSVKDNCQQIIATHPLWEDTWKKILSEALHDIPGLDLRR